MFARFFTTVDEGKDILMENAVINALNAYKPSSFGIHKFSAEDKTEACKRLKNILEKISSNNLSSEGERATDTSANTKVILEESERLLEIHKQIIQYKHSGLRNIIEGVLKGYGDQLRESMNRDTDVYEESDLIGMFLGKLDGLTEVKKAFRHTVSEDTPRSESSSHGNRGCVLF